MAEWDAVYLAMGGRGQLDAELLSVFLYTLLPLGILLMPVLCAGIPSWQRYFQRGGFTYRGLPER